MSEDILTFERLSEIERQERKDDTLADVEDDFYQQVADYLARKDQIAGDDRSEFRKIQHVLEDIIDSRQKKLLKLAFLASRTDFRADNVLSEEEQFMADIRERIIGHRSHLEQIILPDGVDGMTDDTGAGATGGSTATQDDDTDDSTPDSDTGDRDRDREDGPGTGTDSTRGHDTDDTPAMGDDDDDLSEETEEPGTGDDTPDTGDTEDDDDSGEILFGGDTADDEETGEQGAVSQSDEEREDGHEDTPSGRDAPDTTRAGTGMGARTADDESATERGTNGMVMLIATEDIGAFMGVDLQEYGPFEEGDEVQVPADNADALLEDDRAEPI